MNEMMKKTDPPAAAVRKRDSSLDAIRVFSMFCVIAVHITPKPLVRYPMFTAFFTAFLLGCNGFFFMLSGELNLRKEFRSGRDYKVFYLKKLASILIPYIVVTILLTAWNLADGGLPAEEGVFSLALLLKRSYAAFMGLNNDTHLWFMYPLILFTAATPFLSKMVHAMDLKEWKILAAIVLIYGVFGTYLTSGFGIIYHFYGHISGWLFAFLAGYYCYVILKEEMNGPAEKNRRMILYAAGVLCFILNAWSYYKGHPWDITAPKDATYMVWIFAAYMLMKRVFRFRNGKVCKALKFVADHSFFVYMLHFDILTRVTPRLVLHESASVHYVEAFVITAVVSLAAAVVLNLVIFKPVKKLIEKKIEKIS